jgi:hypothetical protein
VRASPSRSEGEELLGLSRELVRIHHDLHIWFAELNPSGLFAQFNSTIACPWSGNR